MEFLIAKHEKIKKIKKSHFFPASRFWTGFPPVSKEMAVFTDDGEIELNGEQSAEIFMAIYSYAKRYRQMGVRVDDGRLICSGIL